MTQKLSVIAAISSLALIGSMGGANTPSTAKTSQQKLEWLTSTLATANLKGKQIVKNPFGEDIKMSANAQIVTCMNDESISMGIERSLVNTWAQTWIARDFTSFQKLLADKATMPKWKAESRKTNSDLLTLKNLKPETGSNDLEFLKKYFAEFTAIDDVELDFVSFNNHPGTPIKHDPKKKLTEAELLVRFDIRGTLKNGRRNDRGTFEVQIVNVAGQWKIKGLNLLAGESVASNKVFFEDTTKVAALDKLPVYIRNEAIRRGGYALAVGDYNNDKILDLYIGNDGKAMLLRGNKDGTFTEDKDSAVSQETSVKTAIFADLNNNGWQDLTIVKFVPHKDNAIKIYHNREGRFELSKNNPEKNAPDYAMPAAIGDFNSDGFLDLYVGFPGVKDFTNLTFDYANSPRRKMASTPQGIYLNDKKGDFQPATRTLGGNMNSILSNTSNVIYPHSAIAVDYDGDGHQDIVVMDDRGGLSPVFRNLGNGTFEQVGDKIGVSNRGYGMGVAVADFNNDGLMDMIMTNVDFTAAHRMINSCHINQDHPVEPNLFARGMAVFKNVGNGKFVDLTNSTGLEWIGQGAGGVEFVDFDNDGWQDVYVVNGLWSGTTRYEDLSSIYSRAVVLGVAWDRPQIDFGRSSIMAILADHKGGLLKADPKSNEKLSMAGFQRNRLFRNNRDGSFTEMGYLAGVDAIADGYVVAKADLNGDGHTDLVLRNADPGTKENQFAPVQIFTNKGPSKMKSVTVQLIGKSSNRDGVGAKVTAWVGKDVITQEMIANNGAAQGEKVIHIGMGSESRISKLEVLWPSGVKSQLTRVRPGRITIEEPTETELSAL